MGDKAHGQKLVAGSRHRNCMMCVHFFIDIYSNMACSVAGITSDANVLTSYLRKVAQKYVSQSTPHFSLPCYKLHVYNHHSIVYNITLSSTCIINYLVACRMTSRETLELGTHEVVPRFWTLQFIHANFVACSLSLTLSLSDLHLDIHYSIRSPFPVNS